MKQFEDKFAGLAPYQPYLQDGQKHFLTKRDTATNYRMAYFSAYADRFPEKAAAYLPEEEVAAEPVEAPAPAETPVTVAVKPDPIKKPCCCKCKKKKNVAAIAIAFIASVLFVALAALNYFKVQLNYTGFFADFNANNVYGLIVDIIGNPAGFGMLSHAFVGTIALAAVLTVISLIVGIVALASRKKVCGVGVLSLIALIAWLAAGVIKFFDLGVAKESADIIKYINPFKVSLGAMLGYYIGAAILLVETICGFASYRK